MHKNRDGFYTNGLWRLFLFHSHLVQTGDSHKEHFSKSSSRSLLYSWDNDDSTHEYRNSYNTEQTERALYVIGSVLVFLILLACRCCIRYGCEDGESNTHSGTVLHSPPRSSATVAPPASRFGYSGTSNLVPPRTTRSIILPVEGETFPAHLYGFDNPNYQAENSILEQFPNYQQDNTILEQYYSPINQNQTPLCNILDMPPSYDTVVKEDIKYPKSTFKKWIL